MSNKKGIAYVNNRDDFDSFIIDFYIFDDAVFEDIRDWYKFFCGGYIDGVSPDYEPDIMQLVSEINKIFIPKHFPALIVFDFEDFMPEYMRVDEGIFEIYPIKNLNIRSIETKDNNYAIAYTNEV